MKIKYRNTTLSPNQSKYCIDCDIYQYTKAHMTCFGLCRQINLKGGFNRIDVYKVLEL